MRIIALLLIVLMSSCNDVEEQPAQIVEILDSTGRVVQRINNTTTQGNKAVLVRLGVSDVNMEVHYIDPSYSVGDFIKMGSGSYLVHRIDSWASPFTYVQYPDSAHIISRSRNKPDTLIAYTRGDSLFLSFKK
jgi:hypothetical protein